MTNLIAKDEKILLGFKSVLTGNEQMNQSDDHQRYKQLQKKLFSEFENCEHYADIVSPQH